MQIRVMSWNIEKAHTAPECIARVMEMYAIDICVLLEVPTPKASTLPPTIVSQLNNLYSRYQNQWHYESVGVVGEAVTYLWHENPAVAGGFRAERYTPGGDPVAGKVTKSTGNAPLHFPETGTEWSRPSAKPVGRGPAFMSFVIDGPPVRRFTVLDLHAPYKKSSMIQSYAAHLYASSLEISTVEMVHASIVSAADADPATATLLDGELEKTVPIHKNRVTTPVFRAAAMAGALQKIKSCIGKPEIGAQQMFADAVTAGVDRAVTATSLPPSIGDDDARKFAVACAMAGTLAATALSNSIMQLTAPVGADTAAAVAAARAAVTEAALLPDAKRGKGTGVVVDAVAESIARAACSTVTFGAFRSVPVDVSVIAGDFNVDYPDVTDYSMRNGAVTLLGANNNAYTELIRVCGGNPRITTRTTRTGPTAAKGKRIYTMRTNPVPPIQNRTPNAPDYVPIDVTSLLVDPPVDYVGLEAWTAGMQLLPRPPGVSWAQIQNRTNPWADRIRAAFETLVLSDTSTFLKSKFDNVFVRPATAALQSGVVDVISELGSWPAHTVTNPWPATAATSWPAATRRLNQMANDDLTALARERGNLRFAYRSSGDTEVYDITPALSDAEEAFIYLYERVSDHLPVYVEIQV